MAVMHFRTATLAMDKGDNITADREYRKVLELVRDYPPALRRLSYVTKDVGEAITLARKALSLQNHPYNRIALVQALLRGSAYASKVEAHKLALVVAKELPDEVESHVLLCQSSLATEKLYDFKQGLVNLKRLAPGSLAAHYFAGIEAAWEERWVEAEREILRARELGLPADLAEEILEKSGIRSHAQTFRLARTAFHIFIGWGAILILLLLTGMILSKITLAAVEGLDPKGSATDAGGARWIRGAYTFVLGVTSIYFYISLPVVILLVIAAGGGIIYGFYAIGRIPIKLVAIVVILMLATIWAMLKSLFVRPKDEDPGERLEEKDAPRLFETLREVSKEVGTAMVDIVFIVPDADIAVFERGSLWKRLMGRTEKCLILGLGVLDGMTQLQLKAILAHEFGHLNNKDTSGGSLALHVRRSIHASANALAESGAAKWYNPAWLFYNAFYRIFLRISQGASRLQEVMADRFAALLYGVKAFAQGLTHAIKRSIEFNVTANVEISQAEKEGRKVRNLYSLPFPQEWPEPKKAEDPEAETEEPGNKETVDKKAEDKEAEQAEQEKSPVEVVEEQFREAMKSPTSPYDSHPAPQKRIEWVERMGDVRQLEDDRQPAWDLLEDSQALQEKLSLKYHDDLVQYWTMLAMAQAEAEAN
jgi:Zn-dependent protease with chaperone function